MLTVGGTLRDRRRTISMEQTILFTPSDSNRLVLFSTTRELIIAACSMSPFESIRWRTEEEFPDSGIDLIPNTVLPEVNDASELLISVALSVDP